MKDIFFITLCFHYKTLLTSLLSTLTTKIKFSADKIYFNFSRVCPKTKYSIYGTVRHIKTFFNIKIQTHLVNAVVFVIPF